MPQALRRRFPKIGLRILKSSAAIALCYFVSFLRGSDGIVFYSHLSALWCMQVYTTNTKKNAIQRTIGTSIGAIYGLFFLLFKEATACTGLPGDFLYSAVISLLIIAVLYTTVVLRKKQASYFSCVVFLSIVVNHITDANPYLFVWNRFLDTMIGIVIGIGVNSFSLPRRRNKETLFISGVDDILLNHETEQLSDYSRIVLNRMIDDGMNFTLSTMRTPASLLDAVREVRLKLPVIVMDGAALYHIQNNEYMHTIPIPKAEAAQLMELFHSHGLNPFTNVVIGNLLLIYHDELTDPSQLKMLQTLKRSPYRNFIQRGYPNKDDVLYFMFLYPTEIIESFYRFLEDNGYTQKYKILHYTSYDYPGYSYIKFYNKDATKENMISYLSQSLSVKDVTTFGTIPGHYDVLVNGDVNHLVHILKNLYMPVIHPFRKTKSSQ